MPRWVIPSVFAVLIGISPGTVRAQRIAVAPPGDAAKQLQTCREGVLDSQARPEDRRRWLDLLLSFDSPVAGAYIVEFLGLSSRSEVQIAVCTALAEQGRADPSRLRPAYIDPLMGALGADLEELREAAAAALAEFPGTDVPAQLAARAGRHDLPLGKRLAAVDALAPNTHRRDVVAQLVVLLDLNVPEITDRVNAALEPIAPRSLGGGADAWRTWWKQKSRLSDEAWLTEQLGVYRDRSRRLTADLRSQHAEGEREQAAVTAKVREFQRELLRPLTPEQRDARLVDWIQEPLMPVKLAALSIVKARIADEGRRPEGEVLAALVGLLEHDSPVMRREALQILQNVGESTVVEAVLAALELEKDLAVRHVFFQSLGKLGSPAAIPACLRELSTAEACLDCVREAALALGQIASKPESKERLTAAAGTIADRYHSVPPDQPGVRAALLHAMAAIGDPAFAGEFGRAVESDDVAVVQAALKGLRAVGDASKLPRCRTLMAHADPRVRLAAIEAVAQLGREEADLETLLARLNPVVEPNEFARDAAWRGCRLYLSTRSVNERIRAIDRLREMPELSIKYMEELVASLAASSNNVAELDAVRDRLSTALAAAGRNAEAVPHLRELYGMRCARGDGSAKTVGLRWLDAVLKSPAPTGCAELIVRLAETSGDASIKPDILRVVGPYVDGSAPGSDADRTRRLLVELRAVPTDLLGEPWSELIARAATLDSVGEQKAVP